MSSIKIIHTADIHLGMTFKNASFSGEFSKKRRYEIKTTFMSIIDRAISSKADILLISGDMFEDEYTTIGELKALNHKFKQAENTNIIIIAGNHDPLLKTSLYYAIDWADNVKILGSTIDKVEFKDLNTVIYGISWDKKKIKEQLLYDVVVEDKDKINILMAHGDIYQKCDYLPIDKDNLLSKGFDYVALGHIHKHDFVTPNIAYCGSPEPLDFGELGEHGIIEGTLSKDALNLSFVPIAQRQFFQLKVTMNESMMMEELIETIKTTILSIGTNQDMYRITLEGMHDRDMVIDYDYLKHTLNDIAYIELKDHTTTNYHLEALKKDHQDSIIGKYIEYMEKEDLSNPVVHDALNEGLRILLSEKVK